MEDKKVDYWVYEGEMVRKERIIKRLWIALIISIILIFAANVVWLYAWMQYDTIGYEYNQDGEGLNIIGDRNHVWDSD